MNFKEIFYYKNGEVYWYKPQYNAQDITKPAGRITTSGYKEVKYKGKAYRYHRIVWELHFGEIPDGLQIDHIDRNKINNSIENLRLCTPAQNSQNRSRRNKGSSKYTGVYFNRKANKFQSVIRSNYKTKYLGQFTNELEAAKAYDIAALTLFGEYAVLNFPLRDKEGKEKIPCPLLPLEE